MESEEVFHEDDIIDEDEDKDMVRELELEEEEFKVIETGPQELHQDIIKRDMIGQTSEHVLKQITTKKVTQTLQVAAPNESIAFGLSFVKQSIKKGVTYVGDSQNCELLVLPPKGKTYSKHIPLSRRPWSAAFTLNEDKLIIGEALGYIEIFSLENPLNSLKKS